MANKFDSIYESLKHIKEDSFNITTSDGSKELSKFEFENEQDEVVDVINPQAENEEELQEFEDSFYLGKYIGVCDICANPSFLEKEDISNPFTCPYCFTEGATFQVVGKVESANDDEEPQEEPEVKDEEDLEESKKPKKVKPLKESRSTRIWKKKGYTLEIDDDYDYGHTRFQEMMKNYGGEWTDSGFTVPARTNFKDVEIGDYIIGSYGDDLEYYQVKKSDIVEDEYEGERFGRNYNAYIVKSTGGTERQLKSIVDEINYDSNTSYIRAELTDLDGETIDALSGIHSANRDASTLSLEETLEILEEVGFDFGEAEQAFFGGSIKESKKTKKVRSLKESRKSKKQLNEDLKIITDISDYEPWAGAKDTWDKIADTNKVDELESYLEDIYSDGITMIRLNDILRYEGEQVLLDLGIITEEEYNDLTESKKLKENKELVDGKADFVGRPHRYKDLEGFKKELLDNPSRLHEYKIVKSITKDIKTFADIDEIIEETKFIGGSIVDGDNITDIVKALEIKSTDGTYLVDPSGYDYARYLAFKPVEKLMKEDLDTTLTKAQIKRLYDIFDFEEDEEIERAYIENGQLKIDYDSPKGGNIYEPDLSGKEGEEKLNFILTGKELKENKSKKLKEDLSYGEISELETLAKQLFNKHGKDTFEGAANQRAESELVKRLKASGYKGQELEDAINAVELHWETLAKGGDLEESKKLKEEFSKTRKFKDGGITYTVSLYKDPSGYVAKWEDDSDNGLGYNNYGYITYKHDEYFINAVNRPIKKESIKDRIIKIVASLREEEDLKESKDNDFEIDNAVGQPFDKVSKHLTDSGFKLAQYGDVRHNDPTKSYAVFEDKYNEITLYYDMVKQGDRDSYRAGEVFDFDIGPSSSINGTYNEELEESKQGFVKKYKGCSIHDTGDNYTVTDQHGTTIGTVKTLSNAEWFIDDYNSSNGIKESTLNEELEYISAEEASKHVLDNKGKITVLGNKGYLGVDFYLDTEGNIATYNYELGSFHRTKEEINLSKHLKSLEKDGFKFVKSDDIKDTRDLHINNSYKVESKNKKVDELKAKKTMGLKESTTIQIKGDADIEVESEDNVKVDVEGAIKDQVIAPLSDEEQEEVEELKDITDELDDAYQFEDVNMSKLVTNFLKENFADVRNYKVNKVRNTKQGLVVEGLITYKNKGTKKTVFTFENFNKNSRTLKVKGDSDVFGMAKAFILEGVIKNKKVIPTSLKYNFKQTFEGVAYKVFGKALLD